MPTHIMSCRVTRIPTEEVYIWTKRYEPYKWPCPDVIILTGIQQSTGLIIPWLTRIYSAMPQSWTRYMVVFILSLDRRTLGPLTCRLCSLKPGNIYKKKSGNIYKWPFWISMLMNNIGRLMNNITIISTTGNATVLLPLLWNVCFNFLPMRLSHNVYKLH